MIEPGAWRRRTRWTRLSYGLLAVAAVVLLVLDRASGESSFFNGLRKQADDLAAPVMSTVAAPFGGLRSIGEAWDRHWAVARQNEELRTQIAELEGWRDLALSLRETVSTYEAILDIPGIDSLDPIFAWTVAESGGQFQHVRLMAIGADKGLQAGYPVLNDRGLVGRIIGVGASSSRVLLLTDASSRVPVMTEDGDVRAMLVGDNTRAPRLEFVTGQRQIREGDRIVTSGDAGLFPRNLPVGASAVAGDGVWRVGPYFQSAPIDAVWIYPHEPIPAPPANPETPIIPLPADEPPAEAPAEAEGQDGAEGAAEAQEPVQQANAAEGETPQ